MNKLSVPIANKSFKEIMQLSPEIVVNPAYSEEYHVTLAEALSLAHMFLEKQIPEHVIEVLKDSDRVKSKEIYNQAVEWNDSFAVPGLIEGIANIAQTNLRLTIRHISDNTYSELKEIQVFAAMESIVFAYMQENG